MTLRVLIANRGEIARRITRTLRACGHESVAVYSDVDRDAPHVREADYAVSIGGAAPTESYLSIEKLLAAGHQVGANAVHPGYGFLSENPDFASAVENEGWTFLGPTAQSIRDMGDKTQARDLAEKAGVPVVPSFTPSKEVAPKTLAKEAGKLGMPVMIKAAAGGGGKGMRVVHEPESLVESIEAAVREAQGAFGDGRVFLERYLENARHVEVQVLGDGKGGAVALGERDCSMQRRHQKIVEESPAPDFAGDTRARMIGAARALVETTQYRGAGTVEFLLVGGRAEQEFFFLEMNTRLQVEHPVTEIVHGLDLVRAQIDVALEGRLPEETAPRGHAIEVRVYAENPANGFLPSTGPLTEVCWPSGPGVRVDAGVERGNEVTVHYDPMLGKIIVHGENREAAIERMRQALAETFIAGVDTSIGFCRQLVEHESFRSGDFHTGFVDQSLADWDFPSDDDPWIQAATAFARQLPVTGGVTTESEAPGVWDTLSGWRMP